MTVLISYTQLPACSAASDPLMSELCLYAMSAAPVAATTPLCSSLEYYFNGTGCSPYASATAKLAITLGTDAGVDAGNTAWVLASTCMVALMSPALGLFNAGLGSPETAGNTVLMSLAALAIVSVQWYLFGYSFTFGPGSESFGSFQWGAFTDVTEAPSGAYGYAYGQSIPHILFASFQGQVAAFAAAILSGAVVGRMKFWVWCVFIFIWTTIVYDVFAHWVWAWTVNPTTFQAVPYGWLVSGAHDVVVLDFAGGIAVCIVSGFSALAAALVLGPRKSQEPPTAHDVPLVLFGATALWFGWLGFAGGQALTWPGFTFSPMGLAGEAFWNEHVAASCGALAWMAAERLVGNKPTPKGAAQGSVAGLAALASGAGYVTNWGAVIIAWVAAPIAYFATLLKLKFSGPDDTLNAFALFAVPSVIGTFCTGIFAANSISLASWPNGFVGSGAVDGFPKQIGYQFAGLLLGAVYSFSVTAGLLVVLNKTVGLRIDEDSEATGIDVSEHGAEAYAKAPSS